MTESAGSVGDPGVSAFVSIIDQPYRLDEAISSSRTLLEADTERVMRIVAIGRSLPLQKGRHLRRRRTDD